MQNLQINPQRLWDTLMETAQIGATAKGGICRLTLTDLDRQVRDWFKAQCEALGCTVTVDEVGNMFARRPGKKRQPRADRHGLASRHPADRRQVRRRARRARRARGDAHAARDRLRDQRARSRSSTGPTRKARASRRPCSPPASLPACSRPTSPMRAPTATARHSAMSSKRIGYQGNDKAGARKFAAMFELHIEQGPILEAESQHDRHRDTACRACAGTRSRSPARRRTPARRRCGCARTRSSAPRA